MTLTVSYLKLSVVLLYPCFPITFPHEDIFYFVSANKLRIMVASEACIKEHLIEVFHNSIAGRLGGIAVSYYMKTIIKWVLASSIPASPWGIQEVIGNFTSLPFGKYTNHLRSNSQVLCAEGACRMI